MKNPFDDFDDDGLLNNLTDDIFQSSDHHADSLFNDVLEHSGHDSFHDHSSVLDESHSGLHGNFHDSGISDMNHSDWHDTSPLSQFDHSDDSGFLDSNFQNEGHDLPSSDLHHTDPDNSFLSEHLPDPDHSGTEFQNDGHNQFNTEPHHTGWTDSFTDSHHHESHANQGDNFSDHHSLHSLNQVHHTSLSLHSADLSNKPYITIDSAGYVYLNGDREVGRIDGHTIYNEGGWNCGYWTTDGKVYDYHDHLKGWVHPDGHVYAKGSNGDLEVYQSGRGVAGGAAYLLLVWCGGKTHI
ncbi:MAG: hypothetical protein GY795_07665 [Desulfobacterales bacterium]|nr:hypothetical protein [Desulfobacterales bacterium]